MDPKIVRVVAGMHFRCLKVLIPGLLFASDRLILRYALSLLFIPRLHVIPRPLLGLHFQGARI